jgi:hypothetical protein
MSVIAQELAEQATALYLEQEAKWCAEMEKTIRKELEVKIRAELEVKIRAELKRKIRADSKGYDWPGGEAERSESRAPLKRSKAIPAYGNAMIAPLSPVNAPLVPPPIFVNGPCNPGAGCHICYDRWCLSTKCTICDPFYR